MDTVVKANEVAEVVAALRFAAQNDTRIRCVKRWRIAMLANAIERRAR